jgi:nicotinate-nucleotide--dimethylbenzimidazole phosphoribosyltransferase
MNIKVLLFYWLVTDAIAPAKALEPVTSDEEGGEEGKRSSRWTRRISGSFQRITGSSKETSKEEAPEAKKDESSAPAASETPAAAETSAAPETAPETTATETTAETPAGNSPQHDVLIVESTPEAKKEKRRSLAGLQGLWKPRAANKEVSPEPAATGETTEAPAPADTEAADTAPAAPVDAPAPTEETATAAPTESKTEKAKRQNIFMSFLPKKDTKDKGTSTAMTNGDAEAPKSTDAAPATSETAPAPADESEFQPPPPPQKKDTLGRRLSKLLNRSRSPDKGKATIVSDEAPKIDTTIESTSEPAATTDVAEPETKPEEPLATTEAPPTSEDIPVISEPTPAPEVSAQA